MGGLIPLGFYSTSKTAIEGGEKLCANMQAQQQLPEDKGAAQLQL